MKGEKTMKNLYVDMDGTVATFGTINQFEDLLAEGYFRNRPPMQSVIDGLKLFSEEHKEDVVIHILSAYLTESIYAKDEKREWLKEHMPWIDKKNIHLIPCGVPKSAAIISNDGPDKDSPVYLLDDYSKNLHEWEGFAIKLRNDINGTNGTWTKDKPSISARMLPETICTELEFFLFTLDKQTTNKEALKAVKNIKSPFMSLGDLNELDHKGPVPLEMTPWRTLSASAEEYFQFSLSELKKRLRNFHIISEYSDYVILRDNSTGRLFTCESEPVDKEIKKTKQACRQEFRFLPTVLVNAYTLKDESGNYCDHQGIRVSEDDRLNPRNVEFSVCGEADDFSCFIYLA